MALRDDWRLFRRRAGAYLIDIVVLFAYLVSAVLTRGRRSIHDILARTMVSVTA